MNTSPTDFSDLDESPEELDRNTAKGPAKSLIQEREKCRACDGSGKFLSKYTGRVVGDCFRCQGTGKCSPRGQKAAETRKKNAPLREQQKLERIKTFTAQHKDVLAYLGARTQHWDFAKSLLQQFAERGSLTENQLAVAYQSMERDEARAQERARILAERPSPSPGTGLDLTQLPEGRYAVPNGDTRLKLLIQRPDAPSQWAGWIFVSDAAAYGARQKYGKQPPGKTYTGRLVPELTQILKDPKAAAIAYGRLTGTCAVCGRHLEDEESVARGIGPICSQRFGE